MNPEKLKQVAEEFARTQELFELTYCKKCFKCIKDVNGHPLTPKHECAPCRNQMSEEMKTIVKKYVEQPGKERHDLRYWALLITLNAAVTAHLERLTKRRINKVAISEDAPNENI